MTDPSDPTRREDFWVDTLKTVPKELIILAHTISYLLLLQFYQFPLHLRKMFVFVLFIIYGLFLFAMPPLVRQVIMLPPSEEFFECPLVLSLVCLFCCFCLFLVTT